MTSWTERISTDLNVFKTRRRRPKRKRKKSRKLEREVIRRKTKMRMIRICLPTISLSRKMRMSSSDLFIHSS